MHNFSAEEYIKELESSITLKACKKVPLPQLNKEDNYIFISYSHNDYKKVYADLAYLYEKGIPFWYDEGLTVGEKWHQEVREKMSDPRCSGVIFYLSESLFLSHSIQTEIHIATGADGDSNVPRMPLKYFSVNLTDMPPSRLLQKVYGVKEFTNTNNAMKKMDEWHHTLAQTFHDDVTYLFFESDSHQQNLADQIREFFGILPNKNTYFFGHAYFVTGSGVIRFQNGSHYDGWFRDNQFNGEGELHFRSGSVYKGFWVNGKRQGEGTHQFSDGAVYQGMWKSDMPDGQGIMIWPDKSKYFGEWKEGKQHNQGTFTFSDGTEYNGQWEYGKRHGQGVMAWPDGTRYDGQWQEGKRHGQGIMTLPDGTRYDGQWQEGKRHGRGVMTLPDGTKYDGQWQEGKRHGLDIMYPLHGDESVSVRNNNQHNMPYQTTSQDSEYVADNREYSKYFEQDMHGRNNDYQNDFLYQDYTIRDNEYGNYWNIDTSRINDNSAILKNH